MIMICWRLWTTKRDHGDCKRQQPTKGRSEKAMITSSLISAGTMLKFWVEFWKDSCDVCSWGPRIHILGLTRSNFLNSLPEDASQKDRMSTNKWAGRVGGLSFWEL